MDIFTFLVDLLIGLWLLAVIVATVRAWQARSPRLARSIGRRPTTEPDAQKSRRREMA